MWACAQALFVIQTCKETTVGSSDGDPGQHVLKIVWQQQLLFATVVGDSHFTAAG